MINSTITCGFVAFFVAVSLMPVLEKVSQRIGAVSETGGRHVGKMPIGRLGGIGVLFGCFVSIIFEGFTDGVFRRALGGYLVEASGITLGLLIVASVGFFDDVKRVPAKIKFGFQLLSATVVYFSGVRISAVDLPFLEPFSLGWGSLPITLLWIVGVINAINLIDGLDGLAGGVLLFASIINLIVALNNNSVIIVVLMSSIVGSIVAFLLFNWYPARIYLGDGGAYSLGFIIAVSGLIAPMHKVSTGIAIVVPVLAAGLPIIDTTLVLLRRILNRRRIFSPDRGHIHHVLLDSGISHRKVVIGLYIVCCILCSIAMTLVLHRNRAIGLILVVASVFGAVLWGFGVKDQLRRAKDKFIESIFKKSNRGF